MWGIKTAKFNLAINSSNWKFLVKVSDEDTIYGYMQLLKIGDKRGEKSADRHFATKII